jgi:hypothetical protein
MEVANSGDFRYWFLSLAMYSLAKPILASKPVI